MKRVFTPYEQTLMARAGISGLKPDEVGDMPIEYLVGFVDFLDNQFVVNENVLIPRIETEELVELALSELKTKIMNLPAKAPILLADVGCGSGVIGISILQRLTKKERELAKIILSDFSSDALKVAKTNFKIILGNEEVDEGMVQFMQSDLLTAYQNNQEIDVIVANLPYIPSSRIAKLANHVKNFEPIIALDGGKDGLKLIRKLLQQAARLLNKSGVVLLEVDDTHTNQVLKNNFPSWQIENYLDQFAKNRFARFKLSNSVYSATRQNKKRLLTK